LEVILGIEWDAKFYLLHKKLEALDVILRVINKIATPLITNGNLG
jgi:hypothetical protein